ncbi:LysR family transcriptional regulator [Litoreibacter janthinus]|uniref:DNA-binding transcriptional regulator, LysR family n=1 Tax=Litoreibacter janthinus TaxID=670154 RepID=A0A1I6GQG6_9RHOB|nr:LysR family transcriptional regulator [Litoreibacter janthinus]SFR44420.1 DNA-binding transcriptional regulator, LysR family [Litoreibacter janthinus]
MAQGQFEYFQMRCFVAVAEELSFRRAADRLNMTQPPLSRQIKILEERVNLRLLERSNRHVSLTSAGESFYKSAVDIIQRSEHAVLNARQAERGDTGSIALGFVPSAAFRFMPLIAQRMAAEMPKVSLTPIEMMGYEVIEAQRSGRIDLGLTRMENPRGDIERTRVIHEPFVLAIPKRHPLAKKVDLTISDFDGEPFISFAKDRGGYLKETLDALFYACNILPDTVLGASQTHAVISLVNHGLGFALVPRSAQVIQMENIVYREIELPTQFRSDMYLVSRSGRNSVVRDRVKRLIIEILGQFREED